MDYMQIYKDFNNLFYGFVRELAAGCYRSEK